MRERNDVTKLSEEHISTLAEMATFRGLYRYRQATCGELVSMGLAVASRPGTRRSPHIITPAGRLALSREGKRAALLEKQG